MTDRETLRRQLGILLALPEIRGLLDENERLREALRRLLGSDACGECDENNRVLCIFCQAHAALDEQEGREPVVPEPEPEEDYSRLLADYADLEADHERLRALIRESYEEWAGSELSYTSEDPAMSYALGIIKSMLGPLCTALDEDRGEARRGAAEAGPVRDVPALPKADGVHSPEAPAAPRPSAEDLQYAALALRGGGLACRGLVADYLDALAKEGE